MADRRTTRTRRRVLRFVAAYRRRRGFPPSQAEIGAAVKVRAASVRFHLARLEEEGFVSRQPRVTRSVVVTPAGERSLAREGRPENNRLQEAR